jgi:hypothetical protein
MRAFDPDIGVIFIGVDGFTDSVDERLIVPSLGGFAFAVFGGSDFKDFGKFSATFPPDKRGCAFCFGRDAKLD